MPRPARMPSLPRIRRTRSRDLTVVDAGPREPAELNAAGLTWIHLDSPTLEASQALAERFGWHPLDVEDVLSRRQRPKVDDYADEGYLFAVLHFPAYDRYVQRLNAVELDVFVGPDYLVTLPGADLKPLSRLFSRCEEDESFREQLFSKGSGRLLYEVLDDLFDYCFPILDKIGHKLDSLEDDVFEGKSDEVVRDLSNAKQEIISYRKIIKPERSTLRLLERHVERFLPEELEEYFDDIVDAAERIWDLLDNYKEVIEALEDTNESVINHRQNDILRILTVFSVILLPLTLISGIFGMNVHFPGFDTAWAFWTIFGVMLGAATGMLAFFRYKRWL
jgi:magnesium transporter